MPVSYRQMLHLYETIKYGEDNSENSSHKDTYLCFLFLRGEIIKEHNDQWTFVSHLRHISHFLLR